MHCRHALWCVLTLASALFAPSVKARPSLRGSPASQRKQNQEADREKLTRIENDAQLEEYKHAGLLVPLPENKTVRIDYRLGSKWRWCRTWTATFLQDLGRDYFARFHAPLRINSAVRTVVYQKQLHGRNGNAARATGARQSSHPTGATVDIAKKEMTSAQLNWMRKRLLGLESKDLIQATEEMKQLVFHVMVFDRYPGAGRRIGGGVRE